MSHSSSQEGVRRGIDFYFDPVCPFAWTASLWLRQVAAARDLSINWRFLSLRLVNESVDYATHFPPGYLLGHSAGLQMLRVAAKTRAELGGAAVGRLQAELGVAVFDRPPWRDEAERQRVLGRAPMVSEALQRAGLPLHLAAALDEPRWDDDIRRESMYARSLTGSDVGTPIFQLDPPGGPAFFGPVISRSPSREQAIVLWEHIVGLAQFGGFCELKRSLRELPQLPIFGVEPQRLGPVEDWPAGRRLTSPAVGQRGQPSVADTEIQRT